MTAAAAAADDDADADAVYSMRRAAAAARSRHREAPPLLLGPLPLPLLHANMAQTKKNGRLKKEVTGCQHSRRMRLDWDCGNSQRAVAGRHGDMSRWRGLRARSRHTFNGLVCSFALECAFLGTPFPESRFSWIFHDSYSSVLDQSRSEMHLCSTFSFWHFAVPLPQRPRAAARGAPRPQGPQQTSWRRAARATWHGVALTCRASAPPRAVGRRASPVGHGRAAAAAGCRLRLARPGHDAQARRHLGAPWITRRARRGPRPRGSVPTRCSVLLPP